MEFIKENSTIISYTLIGLISILMFTVPFLLGGLASGTKEKLNASRDNLKASWKNKEQTFSYKKIKRFLSKNGATYNLELVKDPIAFVEVCFLCALIVGALVALVEPGLVFPAACIGASAPYFFIIQMNKSDNEKMTPDISLIYNALQTQIAAGVFPDDAIKECFSVVKHPRLRARLLQLTGDLSRSDIDFDQAMDNFEGRFNNLQIDSLVVILKQTKTSGRAITSLQDVLEQIKEIEEAAGIIAREKNQMKNQLIELGFFGSIVSMILIYGLQFVLTSATQL